MQHVPMHACNTARMVHIHAVSPIMHVLGRALPLHNAQLVCSLAALQFLWSYAATWLYAMSVCTQ